MNKPRYAAEMIRATLAMMLVLVACAPEPRLGPSCDEGVAKCDGLAYETCIDSTFVITQQCDSACDATLGCTMCQPGGGVCIGDRGQSCTEDGRAIVEEYCDPVQGMSCDPASGRCVGSCSQRAIGKSYIGCEYFPVVTGNGVGSSFNFAIAIANPSNTPTQITIEGGALASARVITAAARSITIERLPWQFDLKLCPNLCSNPPSAALVRDGAYHLRSQSPVSVYQFNPIEYRLNGLYSVTNDASLLLPTNAWGREYLAAGFGPMYYPADNPPALFGSEFAVVARDDGTVVTVTTTADTSAAGMAPAFLAGVPQDVQLDGGDALELTSVVGDLTGSRIAATRPVEVISGHFGAQVPVGTYAADHLEESMFPVETLGKKYLVVAPAIQGAFSAGKPQIVRVVGTKPGTTLTYLPPQANAPASIAAAGSFVELPSSASSYLIVASEPVMVVQYMEGQDAGGNAGDPAMTLAVPIEQFRSSYIFHTPPTYETNYVDVIAETGAIVLLNGIPTAMTPIAGTDYSLSRVQGLGLGPNGDGSHVIEGTKPLGISVYGYGTFTSYWYPGGLDLQTLIQ